MTTFYLEHIFTTTMCDNCGKAFGEMLGKGEECKPDTRVAEVRRVKHVKGATCAHGVGMDEDCMECISMWVICNGCGRLFPRTKSVRLSTGYYMPECVPTG
jgi:hypothetical protein